MSTIQITLKARPRLMASFIKIKTSDLIKADTHREFGRFSWSLLFKGFIKRRWFRVIVTYRLRCHSRAFAALHHWAQGRAGVALPHTASIGPGFRIFHGQGVVISHRAVIGRNVSICQGVTVGDNLGHAPTIEDDVRIAPNAVMVGKITVGKGSKIAPLAYVKIDVPAHSVAMGNPAQIVKHNTRPHVVNQVAV